MSSQALILRLPNEIQFEILETAITLLPSSVFRLALICSHVCKLIDWILYRRVVLKSARALKLFAKNESLRDGRKVGEYVGSLAITAIPAFEGRDEAIISVLHACPNLRSLFLNSALIPSSPSTALVGRNPNINVLSLTDRPISTPLGLHLTLTNLTPITSPALMALLPNTTHLHFAEPPHDTALTQWVDPLRILSSVPVPLHHLSHLSLPRREHANEENDIIFAQCISSLLSAPSALKVLVISIYPAKWEDEHDETAGIWKLTKEIERRDERVVIRKAYFDGVMEEWSKNPYRVWDGLVLKS
ncbi:hypothetical protein SISNIDRAFT_487391 [Sistotremastrum niveocremeum HHB9708]|uniref:F-box domain-containing protein n=1 Tax=Sistotremastrum niveocremeum HHB9708 TaxID=1314777 RepID=A0A164SER4_9AGAM|nr:hypothetical protein SISNIDRAFT_487391 [Sistotremastrum niveocremeum HHB9708]